MTRCLASRLFPEVERFEVKSSALSRVVARTRGEELTTRLLVLWTVLMFSRAAFIFAWVRSSFLILDSISELRPGLNSCPDRRERRELLDCARKVIHGAFVVIPQMLEVRFDLLYKLIVSLNSTVGVDLLECLHDGGLTGEFGRAVRQPAWAWLGRRGASPGTATGGHGSGRGEGGEDESVAPRGGREQSRFAKASSRARRHPCALSRD